MIRHVVVFKFKPEAPRAERERWIGQVRTLPDKIHFIRSFSVGEDALRSERSHDVAIVADFDGLEGVEVYADHPDHLPVAGLGATLTEHRISVDFEV